MWEVIGLFGGDGMSKDYEDVDSFRVAGEHYCVADEMIEAGIKNGRNEYHSCASSNALSVYQNDTADGESHYTGYCYSCSQAFSKEAFHRSSHAAEFGIEGGVVTEKKTFTKLPKREKITKVEVREVLAYGYEGKGERNLKDEYNKFFGHITKLDRNGKPVVRFYPETKDGVLMGYKSRTFLGKKFGYENKGQTGINNDLSGQVKFKDMHFRDIVICPGEEDKIAFFQIFSEHQKKRFKGKDEEYAPMPVVSPTTGEGSAVKQLRAQYDFINRAERIFIGMDADEKGREAAEAISEVFPKDKVYIIHWSYKDPNNSIYNKEGKDYAAQTIRDFYNAKPLDSSGFVGSGELDELIEAELMVEKIPLPAFMSELQDMMAGGIPLGYILNICGETGGGKTSFVNEMLYEWVFNSPHKMGVVSLELTSAQYGIAILSRHIGKKLNLFHTGKEAVEYIRQPEIIKKRNELWRTEDGEDRWTLLDEREGSLAAVQKQCELLYRKYGCKLLVLDPLQDILDGSTNEEQSLFMKWEKQMVKLGVTIININHTRKGSGQGSNGELRDLKEDDIHGSSAIAKSGGANIFLMRDKYGETDIEKNTTYIKAGKIRWTGKSGWAGKWYYDLDSHTIHDFKTYFAENPDKLPAGFDTEKTPFDKSDEKKGGFGKKQDKKNTQPIPDIMDGIL